MAQYKGRSAPPRKRQSFRTSPERLEYLRKRSRRLRRQARRRKIKKALLVLAVAAAAFLFVWFKYLRPYFRKPSPILSDDKLSVHFIDVGQGDAIFVEDGGDFVLVDCGEDDEAVRVVSYLKDLGVKKLGRVVATHPHSDHMGGMYRVIESFDVGEVVVPKVYDDDIPAARYYEKFLDACEEYDVPIREAALGEEFDIGDTKVTVVAPEDKNRDNVNDYSLCLTLKRGETSFLLTGDAEKASETEMIAAERVPRADVLKVGHHGSSTSSTWEFLSAVKPKYAVISCGADNPYGHPHDSTMKKLAKFTQNVYRTDLCETIVFESDGKDISVRTERD